jgi:peptide/nickel transport system substrate-binding protein
MKRKKVNKMRKINKLLALLLICVMTVSLAACSGGGTKDTGSNAGNNPEANASTTPGTNPSADPGSNSGTNTGSNQGNPGIGTSSERALNVAVAMDSGTLHPFGVSGMGGFPSVLSTCYEGLFYVKSDGTYVWVLATSIDRISDIQYTMNIRKGVTFSNGNPLTAEDVMFTMEQCNADPRAFLNVKGVDFEKTKVIDEYTIDFWYTEYNAAAMVGLASMQIFDKESYDEVELSRNPIGTGPYLVTDYVVNSHATSELRDGYWGTYPQIKTIQFKVINEDSQRVNALETGEIDLAQVPLKDAEYAVSLGYSVSNINSGIAMVADFNMTEGSLLGTKEARYAICHAIDREAIVDIVFGGRSKVLSWPASETLVDFEPRFSNMHETYSIGYDPARAKSYAEQAGLIGKSLRIITNGSADYITIAELIQNDLTTIGVNSEIINYDQATYFGLLMDESNYDIAIFNPAAPSVMAADILGMYLVFIPQGWQGPDRDLYGQLSMAALAMADDKTRGDMIYESLKLFLDYTPWFGLCEGVSMRVCSNELQGIEFSLGGGYLFQNMSFVS